MDENKKMEYVSSKEVVLTGISAKKAKDSEVCEKLTFRTNIGDITWKPKQIKKTFQNGIEVEQVVPYEIGLLPKKVEEWGKLLAEKGHLRVTVDYTKMTVDKDGGLAEYRFITSEKTLVDKWVLREDKVVLEKVD